MNSMELFERRAKLKSTLDDLKAELKGVEEQIETLLLDNARNSLVELGKDFGTTYLNVDGQRVKAVLRKKVTWDQDKLRDALEKMPVDDARHYGKISFTVEERKYNEAPPRVREVLEECRTVEIGGATFTLEK